MTSPEGLKLRVVIHAPIGRDATTSADLLQRVGIETCICRDLEALSIELAAGVGAVFVAEEGLFGKDLSAITDWVAAQPAWSDLPFLVLTSRHEQSAVLAWRERLMLTLRNVFLIERPVQSINLSSALRSALRARERQYEVCTLIEAREEAAIELEATITARTGELAEANAELVMQMAERAKFEEVLRQAQKIEAIGQLTGGIAHDFNNLLMVITGGLSLLEKPQTPERQRRISDGMRNAAERGAGLSKQLLAFSRQRPLKPEPVDLPRQIGGMQQLLDRTLRGDVQVQTEFADDLWPIEVDPAELELVLLNLCVNARDAMPLGGTITIRASNEGRTAVTGVSGDFVHLSVADTGTGMTEEVRAKVFEPFFTTKEIGRGSGLGLPQVHGFATQSGGTIEIDSRVGEGTRISLLLPRSAGTPSADGYHLIDHNADDQPAKQRGVVLLVEDDSEVAALVSEMLEQLGWEVVHAASADAALGAFANSRNIDLVFSDVMMPGSMNGVQLAREIRNRRPGLRIVLTTGYPEAVEAEAQAEDIALLAKPYRLADLAQKLG